MFIWCIGCFVTTASGLGNALGYFVQARVYNKPDPISLSYSVRRLSLPCRKFLSNLKQVVAATAGIAIGPLFAVSLARRYGRACVFFWSMVGLLITGIWSATMVRSNQYGPFIAARLFGGLVGGAAPALGAETIVDIFFLHQRGKAFTALNLSFLAGVVVGPTLSGFIVNSTSWTVQFWWSNGLEGISIILTLALLEETYYDRTLVTGENRPRPSDKYFANRMTTSFCGSRIIPSVSAAEIVSRFRECYFVMIQKSCCWRRVEISTMRISCHPEADRRSGPSVWQFFPHWNLSRYNSLRRHDPHRLRLRSILQYHPHGLLTKPYRDGWLRFHSRSELRV